MTPAELSRTVLHAVRRAVDEGALQVAVPDSVKIEASRPGGRGDYASGVALRLAGPAGKEPREVAEVLRSRLGGSPGIEAVHITGGGFLNFTLGGGTLPELLRRVRAQGARYGYGDALSGQPVVLRDEPELRARVMAETLVNLLRSQGARAEIRDGGEAVRIRGVEDQDLLERLGEDAGRWALLRAAPGDPPRPGNVLVQTEASGLFRVRYAASRARALTRGAAQLGFASRYEAYEEDARCADAGRGIRDYPAVLASAARLRSPDRLARHLEALADALLAFQHTVLPRGDEKPSAAHRSRLALAEAAGTVLAGGLGLLGLSAPEYV
ncbi:ArgS-related anticodon-binding protein NrtL [Streptomyces sp. PR69]|uniref:ArgS-related anticodon-binding protein NrtL n=1 Tax=Streptomyces sp. PR69 TaxID=2984950 RepID=UPI002263E174|nr:arginine--tRNA ligase [Streptomyces sp. PR69]